MGAHSTCLSFLPNHSCVATAASFLTRLVTPTSCTDLQTDTSLLTQGLMLVQPHPSQTADMQTNTSHFTGITAVSCLIQPLTSVRTQLHKKVSGRKLAVSYVSCCVVFVFHALFSVLLLLLSVCLWNRIYLFFTFQNCFVCAFSKQIFVPFEMFSASLFLDSLLL